MIYLDNGATSLHKPPRVARAVADAIRTCANPGRGGYAASVRAARKIFACREAAGELFHCRPEQVVLTSGCTHGLNLAIRSLVKPGDPVVISGFEHNAVTRPLHALGAKIRVAGRKLFDPEDTLASFRKALPGAKAAVFTHASNVFGYILPLEELAKLCREAGVPFLVDAAQTGGSEALDFTALGADFLALPGHKGLLGPQGTGLLLCREGGEPLLQGGTGSDSIQQQMPEYLPERLEPGTLNVPGFAGLTEGIRHVLALGPAEIGRREKAQAAACARGLEQLGIRVFSGRSQGGTLSFLPGQDSEGVAAAFARMGIALRGGLHCAPLAHESAGTLDTGTVRLSFGWDAEKSQTGAFLQAASKLLGGKQEIF